MVDNTEGTLPMHGEINWFEMPDEDTAKARGFYGKLFGWRTSEFDGDYHVIESGAAGAIAPKDAGRTHPRVYFATDDIDASVKLVRELGGTADDVVPMPGIGKIAHCQDDQATPFSLYEPAQQA
jgi:predicted enzyme related to lactoylglutathione lyase